MYVYITIKNIAAREYYTARTGGYSVRYIPWYHRPLVPYELLYILYGLRVASCELRVAMPLFFITFF